MCKDCGCGLPGENPVGISAHHEHDHEHEHEHGPGHHHGHGHEHSHTHEHTHCHSHKGGDDHDHEHVHDREHEHHDQTAMDSRRTLEVRRSILEKNDRLAERNRGYFQARGLLVLNVVSSPGSGKTTFLQETVRQLGGKKAGVIVGDLATDNDAQRLRESGAPVVQITTGTVCHLDAEMVARALKKLDLGGLELLIIENVGNLVCPASYDLGEALRVVLLSVTEGEDKPLKYPPMFQSADVVVVSKMDLAEVCGCHREKLLANIRRVSPNARVFETSARTGQGMDAWREFLLEQRESRKAEELL